MKKVIYLAVIVLATMSFKNSNPNEEITSVEAIVLPPTCIELAITLANSDLEDGDITYSEFFARVQLYKSKCTEEADPI